MCSFLWLFRTSIMILFVLFCTLFIPLFSLALPLSVDVPRDDSCWLLRWQPWSLGVFITHHPLPAGFEPGTWVNDSRDLHVKSCHLSGSCLNSQIPKEGRWSTTTVDISTFELLRLLWVSINLEPSFLLQRFQLGTVDGGCPWMVMPFLMGDNQGSSSKIREGWFGDKR